MTATRPKTTRSSHRRTEAGDSGAAVCATCGGDLAIGTDGDGRAVQECRCGRRHVPRRVMSWRMPSPCRNCPFASHGDGLRLRRGLMPGRWREILASLRRGDVFYCHQTTTHDDDGEFVPGKGEKACAGAIAWQEARGCTSNYQRVCERLERDGRTK